MTNMNPRSPPAPTPAPPCPVLYPYNDGAPHSRAEDWPTLRTGRSTRGQLRECQRKGRKFLQCVMLTLPTPVPAVSVMLLVLLCLDEGLWSRAAPVCAQGQARCQLLSLTDLLDRVLQHSARMHGLSNDLHSQWEQNFLRSRNQIGRMSRKCHTSAILTPNGKENAQSLAREELTAVILELLAAWREPLFQLHQSLPQEDLPSPGRGSGSQALEMSDMAHKLLSGVETVAQKMQVLGMLGNGVSSVPSPDAPPPPPSAQRRSLGPALLLHCFRRDSHKVHNYLSLLKCTVDPEHGC
ncbi:prolactin 2 [Conger conger]|uniref:prolactin 2 n=1 Tax=Conger conger TaxID=82655 RepID=UPI002A5992F9|nr:prolactin 2 [Conger conger]